MLKKVKAAVCTVLSVLTISAAFSGCGEEKKSSTVETKPQATEETIVQPTTAVPTTVPSTTDSPSEKQRRYNFLAIKQKSDSIYTKLDDIITENKKYRLIPFQSVSGRGLLPAFLPDAVYINNTQCQQKIYIAVCKNNIGNGSIQAMINPEIVRLVKEGIHNDICKNIQHYFHH